MGGVFFELLSRFVQICLDGCGFVRVWRGLVRLSFGGSGLVWFWFVGLASVEGEETLGAVLRALSGAGSVDVAAVAVGIQLEIPGLFVGCFALLVVVLLDGGQALEQETEFAGGGDGLAMLVGVGLGGGEDVDLVGEPVGGDAAEDVGPVELEVSEVGVDGGAGAAELFGDLVRWDALAVEVVA